MRTSKVYQFTAVLLLTLSLLFLTTSNAFSAKISSSNTKSVQTVSRVKPHASGGGCDPFGASSWSGDVVANGCISYGWPYLYPDGYATIKPLSSVQYCYVAIQLYDANGNYLTGQNYSCAYGRRVHYGPISYFTLSGTYYACIDINLYYVNGTGSSTTSCSYYIYV